MSSQVFARINKLERVDIRTMREKKGISIRQMANRMKIDHRNLVQMEKGMRNMPLSIYNNFINIIENE